MKKSAYLVLAVGLFVIISMSSFKYDDTPKVILKPGMASLPGNTTKDKDVVAYLKEMGVRFMLDDSSFNELFPGVDLELANEQVNLEFPNATASEYQLDIYDKFGNPVVSLIDIFSDEVSVDGGFFEEGTYIYKLTGAGNLYAGKFEYEPIMADSGSEDESTSTRNQKRSKKNKKDKVTASM